MLNLKQLAPGDIATYWHDSGQHAEIAYAKILRKGRVRVRVRDERGIESWVYPGMFNRVLNPDDWFPDSLKEPIAK